MTGLGEHGYKAYERDPDTSSKASPLDFDYAVKWADLLDVRWEWLLERKGVPWRDSEDPAQRVRDALSGLLSPEEVEQIASLTELLDRKRTGTGG